MPLIQGSVVLCALPPPPRGVRFRNHDLVFQSKNTKPKTMWPFLGHSHSCSIPQGHLHSTCGRGSCGLCERELLTGLPGVWVSAPPWPLHSEWPPVAISDSMELMNQLEQEQLTHYVFAWSLSALDLPDGHCSPGLKSFLFR